MTFVPFTLLALAFAGAPPGEAEAKARSWRFVLPAPGEAFEHPPFRRSCSSRDKPEDVAEKIAYRGKHRRYAQVRFGSAGSVRVTVVLDEVGPGDVDLYVDANRDRKIDRAIACPARREAPGETFSGACPWMWRWSREKRRRPRLAPSSFAWARPVERSAMRPRDTWKGPSRWRASLAP